MLRFEDRKQEKGAKEVRRSEKDGKRRREWEEIKGEEWIIGRWEAGETEKGMGRQEENGRR